MKSRGVGQNFAWGFYAYNRNTDPQRGTIPTRGLPCSSKTAYGNNDPPQSNRAPSDFLKRSFREALLRRLGEVFIPGVAHKQQQSQGFLVSPVSPSLEGEPS